jgi:hypothetical protein
MESEPMPDTSELLWEKQAPSRVHKPVAPPKKSAPAKKPAAKK